MSAPVGLILLSIPKYLQVFADIIEQTACLTNLIT